MATPTHPEPAAGLTQAAAREAAAARELGLVLRRAREAAQRLDVDGLGEVLEEARRAADDLARAGGRSARLGAEASREAGRASRPPQGPDGQGSAPAELPPALAAELRDSLELASREATALGICVRYGGSVAAHLSALAGNGPCYGPGGRLGSRPRAAGRTA